MPELPEVETTLKGIAPHVINRQLTKLVVRNASLRWPVPTDLASHIVGKEVRSLKRRAKYLLWEFDSGHLLVHLGMSGSLRVVPAGTAPGKHDHVDLQVSDGQMVRYTDPRRFGAVLWVEGALAEHSLLKELGPEPLTDDFDGEWLYQCSRRRKVPIKSFIMDNKVVVGVGNIYANEALFMSGIHPKREAGSISKARYLRLGEAIKQVLSKAVAEGGTTLRDFVGGDGKPGYFKQELQVYGRGGEPCRTCGKTLKEIRLGQRATVFCSACQT